MDAKESGIFRDTFDSLRSSFRERLSSPLLGTFTISWLLWNYRLVSVMFSELSTSERFKYIDSELYADLTERTIHQVIGPTLTTAVFLWLYPILAKFVYRYWRQRQMEMRVIRQQIDNETLLSKEESRRLIARMTEMENVYEAEIQKRDEQIRQLKDTVTALKSPPPAKDDVDVPVAAPSDIVLSGPPFLVMDEILSHDRKGRPAIEEQILSELSRTNKFDPVTSKFLLGELTKGGLIKPGTDPRTGQRTYVPTHEGRRAYVALGDVGRNASKATASPEQQWEEEMSNLSAQQKAKVVGALNNVLSSIANPRIVVNDDEVGYAIAKGLATREGNQLILTPRGKVFANRLID